MGNSQSSSTQSLIDTLNENITNVFISNSSVSSNFCKSNQTITLENVENKGCRLLLNQTGQVVCDLKNQFEIDNTTKLSTLIDNAIDNTAKSEQESVQGFLAAAVSVQSDQKRLVTHIKNIVRTNMTLKNMTECANRSEVQQGVVLKNVILNCEKKQEDQVIDQNIQLRQFADCTTKSVIDILKNDELVNKVVNSAETKQKSQQKGLDDLLKSLVLPLLIMVAGLVVVYVIIKSVSGSKDKKADTYRSAVETE